MQVSRIGLTEPARLATPLGTSRKPVAPTRLRLPTKLVFPNAAASTRAPARATGPNAPLQARQATDPTPPSHTVGHSLSSRITGQVVHPPRNGTLSGDNKQSLLQRKYNSNTATQRNPAGRAASTSSQNITSRAKATSTFLSSPLGQNPKCMLKTGSQELQPRAQMHARQSGEAAMALAKSEAGSNAFTFRVSGAPDLARSSKHRAEMPASTPQPTRLVGASPAREVKQPATTTTTTTTSGVCAVVDALASLEAMPRGLSVGQGLLLSEPVASMEECSERLERLLQRVHKANEENAALKALKLPTTPKTPTLARSSTTSSSNDWADGSRRRAATVDSHMSSTERSQNASVRIQRRLEEIRARRLARKEEEQKASSTDSKVASPAHMPTTEIRIKVEKLRARRQAREEEERMATNARNAFSPQSSSPSAVSVLQARTGYLESGGVYRNCSGSETAVECAADTDEDVYFFDNKDVIAMFREIPLPFKELDWEKQVHNFHVARTNDAYRKDTDDIKLRNCRAECIVDILGEKAASHVTAQESECGKEQQVQRRQSRLGDENVSNAVYNSDLLLIDSDFEDDNESERSSEWSRNGFGYIELRRMSRMSLEVPCEQSPVCRESGAKELGHGTSASVSPLSPIVPNSAKPQSPGTAHVTAAKFSKSITPSVMCRSSTNTNSITRANGGDTNSKGMLAKMRKSVDRVVPPPNRCDTLVNSMSTLSDSGALQQAASHPVPPAKVSSANEQILGHIANSSLLSIEQQMTQLTAENRMLKRQMLQARKAVDALARVVIRMQ